MRGRLVRLRAAITEGVSSSEYSAVFLMTVGQPACACQLQTGAVLWTVTRPHHSVGGRPR